MIADLFHSLVYTPLYNALVGIHNLGSWVDMGIAVIVLTILVRIILAPLSLQAARTQRLMRAMEPEIKKIRETYSDDREKQGRKMLELYREKGINPFSGILMLFIQIPVILGLYFVFLNGGLPGVNTDLLYSFVHAPFFAVETSFLGFVDMLGKSMLLAVLAGVTQHIHARYSFPAPKNNIPETERTFQDDFMRSMRMQMLFVLPVIVVFVGYITTAAVALYWVTSNICSIVQEWYVKKKFPLEDVK